MLLDPESPLCGIYSHTALEWPCSRFREGSLLHGSSAISVRDIILNVDVLGSNQSGVRRDVQGLLHRAARAGVQKALVGDHANIVKVRPGEKSLICMFRVHQSFAGVLA